MAVFDVAVIGAGPAGSAAARLLASWGHRVALLHRPGDGVALAESIPPSTRKLFDAIGIAQAIDAAGFRPWRGNTVWWGGGPRVESFPPGVEGLHVVRADFDRLLRSLAAAAGATLIAATVRDVRHAADVVRLEAGADRAGSFVDARWALDCSGRAGVLARRFHLRAPEPGYRTVALAGTWSRADGWGDLDSTHTLVETYADGWLWSVPVSEDRRQVTVMIDPRTTAMDRGGGVGGAYHAELAKAAHAAARLRGAALVSGPTGCDASVYTASRFHGERFLLAGDAGSCLDPLSSFGVKKALASAWLAAIVAHTWLERPAMRDAALAFFDAREREMYASGQRRSREFAAAAAGAHPQAFWTSRAWWDAGHDERGVDVERLREDPGVLAAFAAIRAAPALRLRRSSRARIERRPAVAGREIVLQESLVVPGVADGVRFLRGVDLPHLVELAPRHADAGAMFDAYNRERAPAGLPDFLGALAALVAWGVLGPRD